MKQRGQFTAFAVFAGIFKRRTFHRAYAAAKKTAVVLLCAQTALCLAEPAWAQRRDAEPEVNPQFSQQDQSAQQQANSMEGTPVGSSQFQGSSQASYSSAPPPSIEVGQQLPSSGPAPSKSVSPLDKVVSVRLRGAPLATFLQTISAQSNVNFIITEGLESRTVTVFLQKVTVREALQVLLELKGLTYQQVGHSNTYIVMPRSKTIPNLITRIYALSYIPLIPIESIQAEQASITPGSSGSGMTGGSMSGQSSGSSTSGSSQRNTGTTSEGCSGSSRQGQGGEQQQSSEIPILGIICSVLSPAGHAEVDQRTNSLIVTDIPEVFPQVDQIISALDKKTRQVMIEAQIVEIDSDKENDLGVSWGGNDGELASFTGGQRDTSFPMVLPSNLSAVRFLDPVVNVISTLGTQSAASTANSSSGASLLSTPLLGSNVMTSVLNLTSLQVILRALVSHSEARFLGKPKILTLNNKPAIIQTVDDQAIFVPPNPTGVSGATVVPVTPERVSTGLTLVVTPQINTGGYITMSVKPIFTNVQSSALSSALQPVFDPITRSASTMVRVKNGQTLVVGGLLQSTENKTVRKVPFLGYIPLIGWLFTDTSSSRINSDLVIFITPTIVSD